MEIKITEQETYADIIKDINAISAEQNEIKIQEVLRTKVSNVLVKPTGDAKDKALLTYAVKKALGGVAGELKSLDSKETVEIMDLNSQNNIIQVTVEAKRLFPEYMGDLKVTL